MPTRSSSSLIQRIIFWGATGALAGFALGYSLAAGSPIPLLLALAGMAIGATLAQGVPETDPEREAESRRLAQLPAPKVKEPAWLPDPLGGDQDRLWDGTEWTRHVWRRGTTGEPESR
jgi:hypothetical protein